MAPLTFKLKLDKVRSHRKYNCPPNEYFMEQMKN